MCNCIDCVKSLFDDKNCFICEQCGAVYKDKPPEHKQQFFNETTYEKNLVKYIGTKIVSRRFWDVVSNHYIKYLKQKTDFVFKNALDVGALYGNFVNKLNESGINAEGIEASKHYLQYAVTDKIYWGYFDENYMSSSKYDLICFTQMLYYVQNPTVVLEHAKTMLTKDGFIFVSTQNPSSSIIKEKKIPEIIENGMNVLFSKTNFESLKNKIGLELIDYTTYRPDIFLQRFASKKVKNEVLNYLKFHWQKAYCPDPDGHHAFLLLRPVHK